MVNAALTSMAIFGASVSALGRAHVVNKCSYDVYMCETPASGGGYETIEKTLKPGEEWDQPYTSLTNGAGWSIKLSKTAGAFGNNILQYEYTYQNDNMIWYDLSCVDGNPWDRNWQITANTDSCQPRQAAYRFATDDAYGMQSCASDASITVTLCSGEAGEDSPPASPPQEAPPVAPATYPAATSTSAPWAPIYNFDGPSTTPTTFATMTTVPPIIIPGGAVIVTEFVTEFATATQYVKRHQHHPRGAAHQHA